MVLKIREVGQIKIQNPLYCKLLNGFIGHGDDSLIPPLTRTITKLVDSLVRKQFPDVIQYLGIEINSFRYSVLYRLTVCSPSNILIYLSGRQLYMDGAYSPAITT